MTDLPNDLIPLPTMPYDERPASLPMDIEECRTALWRVRGNVTEAAKILKVAATRLRKFIATSPRLIAEQAEAREQLLDVAEDVAYEALTDVSDGAEARRDAMARFVMSNLGKERGYGTNNGKGGVAISLPGRGKMEIVWGDGSNLADPKTIEGEVSG